MTCTHPPCPATAGPRSRCLRTARWDAEGACRACLLACACWLAALHRPMRGTVHGCARRCFPCCELRHSLLAWRRFFNIPALNLRHTFLRCRTSGATSWQALCCRRVLGLQGAALRRAARGLRADAGSACRRDVRAISAVQNACTPDGPWPTTPLRCPPPAGGAPPRGGCRKLDWRVHLSFNGWGLSRPCGGAGAAQQRRWGGGRGGELGGAGARQSRRVWPCKPPLGGGCTPAGMCTNANLSAHRVL